MNVEKVLPPVCSAGNYQFIAHLTAKEWSTSVMDCEEHEAEHANECRCVADPTKQDVHGKGDLQLTGKGREGEQHAAEKEGY